MRPSTLLRALLFLAAGCGHVIHPAAVQPGFTLEILAGQASVRHEPMPSGGGPPPGMENKTNSRHLYPPGYFAPYSSWRPALQLALG
jgi:hypothetical protein